MSMEVEHNSDGKDAVDPIEPIEIDPLAVRHFSVDKKYMGLVRDLMYASNRWGSAGNTLLEHPSDEVNPRRLVTIIAANHHMAHFLSLYIDDQVNLYSDAEAQGMDEGAILRFFGDVRDVDKMAKSYGHYYRVNVKPDLVPHG